MGSFSTPTSITQSTLYTVRRCPRPRARDLWLVAHSPQGKLPKITQYFLVFTPFEIAPTHLLHREPSVYSLAKEVTREGEEFKKLKAMDDRLRLARGQT